MSVLNDNQSLQKLRRLVEQMLPKEKHDFKRHIRSYREDNHHSQYVQLFDCINDCLGEISRAQNTGDAVLSSVQAEQLFVEKFERRIKRRGFMQLEEVGVKSNYLYNKLLESLRRHNTDQSIRIALLNQLENIAILHRKGLFQEALEKIADARGLALQIQAIPILFDLFHLERDLGVQMRVLGIKELRKIHEQERKWLTQLQLNILLYDLRHETLMALLGHTKVEEDPILLAKLNEYLSLHTGGTADISSFEVKMNFVSVLANISMIDLQHPSPFLAVFKHEGRITMVEKFKEIVDLYNAHPLIKHENPNRYLNNLFNYLLYDSVTKKEVNIEDYKEDLALLSPSHPNYLGGFIFAFLANYVQKNMYKEATALLLERNIWELVEKKGHQISLARLQNIQNVAGLAFWVRGDLEWAEKWFGASLIKETGQENALLPAVNELNYYIVQYERGQLQSHKNRDALVRGVVRRIQRVNETISSRFIELLGEILHEIIVKRIPQDKLQELAGQWWPELETENKKFIHYENFQPFIAWLQSKAENKPLRITILQR
ncbi:MAG: hypothetical protein J0L99_10850 [Chitinophagales bacterium]|nr:hypothetical protein [Chitinophagales bacterium]